MALLSSMGTSRWDRPSRKYGAMHGKQLLCARVLEKLAPKLQSLDYQVGVSQTRIY